MIFANDHLKNANWLSIQYYSKVHSSIGQTSQERRRHRYDKIVLLLGYSAAAVFLHDLQWNPVLGLLCSKQITRRNIFIFEFRNIDSFVILQRSWVCSISRRVSLQ